MSSIAPALAAPRRSAHIETPFFGFLLGVLLGVVGVLIAAFLGAPPVRAWAGYGFGARAIGFISLIAFGIAIDKMTPATQHIASRACACSFEVPSSMQPTRDLNDKADLQYADRVRELYLVDLVESRQDIVADSVATYAGMIRMKRDTTPFGETTLGGFTALRRSFTEHGRKNGEVNAYLIEAVVQTPQRYHHILAWTLASKRAELGAVLEAMVASFRAVEGPQG